MLLFFAVTGYISEPSHTTNACRRRLTWKALFSTNVAICGDIGLQIYPICG